MRDILPPSSAVWNRVEGVAREVFRTYNYHEIRTPILEETGLFARGVGTETDIVGKEMYTFEDRDGSSLTLVPKPRPRVMRAYIEHRLDQIPGVKKLYYIGPDVPPGASAERPLPAVFSDRRGGDRIGIAAGGRRSDRDGAWNSCAALAWKVFRLLLNSVGDHNCRPAFIELLKEKLAEVAPQMCTRLPAPGSNQSAARAGLQGPRRSAHY